MSERRACRLLSLCRAPVQYQPRRKADEAVFRARMPELAMERGGFGCPRLTVLPLPYDLPTEV